MEVDFGTDGRFDRRLNALPTYAYTTQVPIGHWPTDPKLRQIGRYMQVHAIDSVEPPTLALFTRVLGWTEMECRVLIAKVKEEFKDSDKQLFVYTHFFYGKKLES